MCRHYGAFDNADLRDDHVSLRQCRRRLRLQQGRVEQLPLYAHGNPTVVAVEQSLALLDRAERALLFSSGMAAIATTLMGHLNAGDEVLCVLPIYGGTLHLLEDLLSRFGIRTRFVSPAQLLSLQDVIGEHPHRLVRDADQSDLALRRYPRGVCGVPGTRCCQCSTTPSRVPSTSSRWRLRVDLGDAKRDEVSERS